MVAPWQKTSHFFVFLQALSVSFIRANMRENLYCFSAMILATNFVVLSFPRAPAHRESLLQLPHARTRTCSWGAPGKSWSMRKWKKLMAQCLPAVFCCTLWICFCLAIPCFYGYPSKKERWSKPWFATKLFSASSRRSKSWSVESSSSACRQKFCGGQVTAWKCRFNASQNRECQKTKWSCKIAILETIECYDEVTETFSTAFETLNYFTAKLQRSQC